MASAKSGSPEDPLTSIRNRYQECKGQLDVTAKNNEELSKYLRDYKRAYDELLRKHAEAEFLISTSCKKWSEELEVYKKAYMQYKGAYDELSKKYIEAEEQFSIYGRKCYEELKACRESYIVVQKVNKSNRNDIGKFQKALEEKSRDFGILKARVEYYTKLVEESETVDPDGKISEFQKRVEEHVKRYEDIPGTDEIVNKWLADLDVEIDNLRKLKFNDELAYLLYLNKACRSSTSDGCHAKDECKLDEKGKLCIMKTSDERKRKAVKVTPILALPPLPSAGSAIPSAPSPPLSPISFPTPSGSPLPSGSSSSSPPKFPEISGEVLSVLPGSKIPTTVVGSYF